MSKFAIVRDGAVVNIVVAKTMNDVHTGEGETVAPFAAGAEIGGTVVIGEGGAGSYTPKPKPAPPAPTVHDVKTEAYRRIVALCPEWKQRNLTAQATQLLRKGEANWTQDEAAAWSAGQAIWNQIAAIRAASDTVEAMDPIPDDFRADSYWS